MRTNHRKRLTPPVRVWIEVSCAKPRQVSGRGNFMTSSAFLRREVAVAGRRLMAALRLDRKLTRLRKENSAGIALPSASDCRQLIEDRTAEYLAVLTRFRVALEQALPRKSERITPLTGAHSRNPTRLHCGVRRAARSHYALARRKQRHG